MVRKAAVVTVPNGSYLQGQPNGRLPSMDSRQPQEKVVLKKKVTLLRGISIIIGTIIGAGIFISPKGILKNTGSVGMSLIVWTACGILSLFGKSAQRFQLVWRGSRWIIPIFCLIFHWISRLSMEPEDQWGCGRLLLCNKLHARHSSPQSLSPGTMSAQVASAGCFSWVPKEKSKCLLSAVSCAVRNMLFFWL